MKKFILLLTVVVFSSTSGHCMKSFLQSNKVKWTPLKPSYQNFIIKKGVPIKTLDNFEDQKPNINWNPQKPTYKKIITKDEEKGILGFSED